MGSKTNTAKQTTAPPADVMAQYQALLQRASGVSTGNTVAPFTGSQNAAFGSFDQIPGQYLPQATNYATQGAEGISPGQISQYENPYQHDVTNATIGNINETNAEQQNQVKGNAIAQGALGGNRVGVAQGELARQQGLANNQTLAGLNANNYQQALAAAQADRAAKAAAAGQFAGLQGTAIQGAGAQLASGTQQQQQAASVLQQPYNQAGWLAGITGAVAPQEGTTTTQQTPGPNILSQLLGLGVSGLGIAGGLGWKPFAADGGRVGYADGGGIAPPFNSRAHEMMQTALDIANKMTGSAGGDAFGGAVAPSVVPHGYDIGGIVPNWGVVPSYDPNLQTLAMADAAPTTGIGFGAPPTTRSMSIPSGGGIAAAPMDEDGFDPSADGSGAGIAAPTDATGAPAGIGAGPRKGNDWSLPLITAGLGMMASQSPFIGTAIGEGGMKGVQAYQQQKNMDRQIAANQAMNAYRQARIDQGAARLDQEAKNAKLAADRSASVQDRLLNAPQSVEGKLAKDFKSGLIDKETYDAAIGKATSPTGATNTDDIGMIAQGIMNGDQPPTLTGLYRNAAPVRAALEKNGYNLTKASQDYDATKRLLSTLNGAGQTRLRQAVSFVSDSLDKVDELAQKWDAGKFPALNKITMSAALQGVAGPEAQSLARQLQSQIADMQGELAVVYKGGNSPTDKGLEQAANMINPNDPMQTVLDSTKLIRQNMQYRVNSLKQATAGIPASKYNPMQATQASATPPVEAPPAPGARKAPDGKWYAPDPNRPGKYLMVQP